MKPQQAVALSVLAYSACSGSLVLVNKLILHNLPYPSLVVSMQLCATLLFIFGAKASGKLPVDELVWKHVVPYLYYIIGFSLGVYCNMKSLSLSNVETVVVFRALTPCLVAVADALFLGREFPSRRSWAGLLTIVVGAYGYASQDEKFQTQGYAAYFWPTLYLLIIAFEMCYGKKIVRSVDLKTLSGPVLYTNLLGLAPMLAFAAMGGEYRRFYHDHLDSSQETKSISLGVWCLLLLGCIAGTSIGYSSWWCRDQVSATSFTLIGVMNKCLTIMLNFVVWDQHASPTGVAFLFLCLAGGMIYQQAPLRKTKDDYQLVDADLPPKTSEHEDVEEQATACSSAETDDGNVSEEETTSLVSSMHGGGTRTNETTKQRIGVV